MSKQSRQQNRSTPPPEAPKRTGLWITIAVGAVVALVAMIAIFTSGKDEQVTVGSDPSQSAETWPVTITGSPLEPLPDSGADPVIGTPAPGLSGRSFDGTPVKVDPSKGPVMLVFLAHWCPHCNREAPQLMQWKASGAVPEGLQVIAVTTAVDSRRDHYPPSTWILDEMKWTWPVLADSPDSEAFTAMGGGGFPYVVIVGTDGKVLDRWSGELGEAGIQARVDAALA